MWNLLADFPSEIIKHHFSGEKEPLAELIVKLQERSYANSVYAFTSLWTFCVTLDSEYSSVPKSDGISVSYVSSIKSFSINYYSIKSNTTIGYTCTEKQAETLFDAFVLRLFLTEADEFTKIEPEDEPTFQIGQRVETIIDEYSRKYHKGVIYKIERHHRQNRFMYFIEENGKPLKKRYFKDNLRSI